MTRWGLPAVALAAMTAFWPWWEGGGLSPRWGVLLVGIPLLLLTVKVRPTPAHWVGAAFFAWAALSLLWTPVPAVGAVELVRLGTIGVAFLIGAEYGDLRPTYLALILGVSLSGALAVAQAFGFAAVPQAAPPAGLFVNKNYLAEIAACALVLCCAFPAPQRWILMLLPALAVLLAHSRGVYLALALTGLVVLTRRSSLLGGALAGALLIVALLVATLPAVPAALRSDTSLAIRFATWRATAEHLTLRGHGVGSFMLLYPTFTPHPPLVATRPELAHDEALNEASDLGLPGIALAGAFFVLCLGGRGEPERSVLVALLGISLWSFPFHLPATNLVAGLVAGRLARLRWPLRANARDGGAAFREWLAWRTRLCDRP